MAYQSPQPYAPKDGSTPPPKAFGLTGQMDPIAARMMREAEQQGRHGATNKLCGVCREWVDFLYYRESGGGQGSASLNYCYKCWWEKYGRHDFIIDPDTGEVIKEKPSPKYHVELAKKRRTRTPFNIYLIKWAIRNFQPAVMAFDRSDNRKWHDEVLASIYRERVKREPAWHIPAVCSVYAPFIYRLSHLIKRAGGYPLDRSMSYREWMDNIRAIEGVAKLPIRDEEEVWAGSYAMAT